MYGSAPEGERLAASVRASARQLLAIYGPLTTVVCVAFIVGGMSVEDAARRSRSDGHRGGPQLLALAGWLVLHAKALHDPDPARFQSQRISRRHGCAAAVTASSRLFGNKRPLKLSRTCLYAASHAGFASPASTTWMPFFKTTW